MVKLGFIINHQTSNRQYIPLHCHKSPLSLTDADIYLDKGKNQLDSDNLVVHIKVSSYKLQLFHFCKKLSLST